jgi:16S rRNA (guanine966-N2)-methyltransferase
MRITGGKFGSRALRAPKGHATRPTTDRVREALFSILVSAGIVEKARVLDLYAGTGALGLEALSRGAARAILVESSREAIASLRANVAALGLERSALLIAGDVERVGGQVSRAGPYDLVLADPPWSMVDRGEAGAALSSLVQSGAVAQAAWVVLEHSSRTDPPDLHGLVRLDLRRYGDTALTFYKPAILAPLRP